MRIVDYTKLESELVDFVERGDPWFFGMVVPTRLAQPLCAMMESVRQRNSGDLQLTLPIEFKSGEAFVDQCRAWIHSYLATALEMPCDRTMPAARGGQDPANALQALAVWVREQMPQSASRRLTVALIPPQVADPVAYHTMLARLSSPGGPGPCLMWVASTPTTASFPPELVSRPGTMTVAVQARGGANTELGGPTQRALGGLQAAGQALANGRPQAALCWCRVLTMHAVVRENPVLFGLVQQAQGDAFRELSAWPAAHRCYRRALLAFMEEKTSGALLGGVLTALAVSGRIVGDPCVPDYVSHARRLNADACLSRMDRS